MTFRPLGERQLDFSSFNIPWYRAFGEVLMYKTSGKQTAKIQRHSAEKEEKYYDCVETVSLTGSVDGGMNDIKIRGAKETTVQDEAETTEMSNVAVRQNFAETAFFMPCLETDDKGDVKIKYTLPESVTTWRLLGIAHDEVMNIGQLEAEAVAQKQLMVEPNIDRKSVVVGKECRSRWSPYH